MKSTEILILGGAVAFALFVYTKTKKTTTGGPAPGGTGEVLNAGGLPFNNGWRYYDNGTSIDPMGNYYFGGALVWSPGK